VRSFVVDEDMPRSTAVALKQAGFSAVDVRDVGLQGRPDAAVFAYAQTANSVIITADLGFASIVNFPPTSHNGIIVVRVPNSYSSESTNAEILRVLKELDGEELGATVVVVEPGRTRLHRG